MKRILVCTDGEDHSTRAEEHAILIAAAFGASITGLYVRSTHLTKFTHEIYAVGRNECRDHLDAQLAKEGTAALDALGRRCIERGVSYESKMLQGDIAEEIVKEASESPYDLLVMGTKLLGNWRERIESANVPLQVFKRAPLPTLFVR